MFQRSFAKPAWAVWLPFPVFCFQGIYGSAFLYGARYKIVSVPYFTILGLRL